MSGRAIVVAMGVLAATAASADELYLSGGGCLTGILVERTATSVTIEIGAGRVSLPAARVLRVVEGESALSRYLARAGALPTGDVQGWLRLGRWARDAGLASQAREAFERVIEASPQHEEAHRALGHVRVGDRWLTADEAMRAQGYVSFEGEWVTPEQHAALLAEREAIRRERLERDRLAVERARIDLAEAEARARTAEAEARAEREVSSSTLVAWGTPVFGVPWFVPSSPRHGGRYTAIPSTNGPQRASRTHRDATPHRHAEGGRAEIGPRQGRD